MVVVVLPVSIIQKLFFGMGSILFIVVDVDDDYKDRFSLAELAR